MSSLVIDRPSTTTRAAAATITSSVGGNFYNSGVGYAVLEASGATWVTDLVRKGDYVQVNGGRETNRIVTNAATTYAGGESIKWYNGDDSRSYVLWFQKDGSGSAPAITTEILIGPVLVVTGDSANTIGGKIRTALGNTLRNTTVYGKDFLATTGATTTANMEAICPGNSTNIAIFSGAGFATVSTPTAGTDLTSGNQGIYRVHEVISETMLLLNTNWIASGVAVDGTATVFIGDNRILYTDETTITMDDIVADCADETLCEQIIFGAANASWPFKLYRACLSNITFTFTGATTCNFNIHNSIVCGAVGPTAVGGASTTVAVSGSSGQLNINVGLEGATPTEFSDGSVVSAFTYTGGSNVTINVAGSVFMNRENVTWTGVNNTFSGMTIHGQIPTFDTNSGNIETFNNIIIMGQGSNGLGIFADIDNSSNVVIADSPASGFLVSTGDFTISGLEISASAFTPIFNMAVATSNPTVLDPVEDYTLDELFTGSAGTGTKAYTFNPTFVAKDDATELPVPLEDLTVTITQIRESDNNEATPDDFTTDVNGKINAGAGLEMIRGDRVSGNNETYKYRIRVQGPTIRLRTFYYVPRQKFLDDITFAIQSFDLEGELGI